MDQELGTGTSMDKLFSSSVSPSNGIAGFPCLDCGTTNSSHGVLNSCLDCFLCGGSLHKFEYNVNPVKFLAQARGGTCTMADTDETSDVIHRAQVLLRNGFGEYNLFENNCEDFVLYCKTELLIVDKSRMGRSGQTSALFNAPISAMLSSSLSIIPFFTLPGILTVASGVYCYGRYSHDIGIRKDTIKLSVEDLVLNLGLGVERLESEIVGEVFRRMLGANVGV